MEHQQYREWLELSLNGELSPENQQSLDAHVASCEGCRQELEDLKHLRGVVSRSGRLVPTDEMLQAARMELRVALRTERNKLSFWESVMERVDDLLAPGLRIALVGASMLLVGFFSGYLVYRSPVPSDVMGIQSVSSGTEVMRGQAQITNVKFEDSDPSDGTVAFKFDAVTPLQVKGSLTDPGVQSVLTKALLDEENPGVRLRAVSAISSQIQIQTAQANEGDTVVKHALVEAMKYDDNPGVRKEAMEALKKFKMDDEIKVGLLYVLTNDKVDGMRVEAINRLAKAKDETYASDERLLEILRKRVESDNNRYVRQGARAVLQEVK